MRTLDGTSSSNTLTTIHHPAHPHPAKNLIHKLELETQVIARSHSGSVSVSADSRSFGSAFSNQDTLHPPSVSLPPGPTTSNHPDHQPCHLGAHIHFDPIVRIIRTLEDDDSSDDDLPALSTSRRLRNIPSKGPVRLCTKKFTLPLNISTSSLIGSHHNQSTSSLPSSLPSGAHSVRQLFEKTRQEIEEDEQFIPDTPRHLNLILPLITRQPSRRTIRQQEERRLKRWRELFGGGKSNLKSSHYSHLYYLSADLRKLLSESSPPVQLSTNTAINSIHSAISPSDILTEQSKTKPPLGPNVTELQKAQLDSSLPLPDPIELSKPAHSNTLDLQAARIPNLVIDELSSSQTQVQPISQHNERKISRLARLGARLKPSRLAMQRDHRDASVPDTSSNPHLELEKVPTGQPLNEGAPLKRMSTPRALVDEITIAGAPLQRASTPATAVRKHSTLGAPLQRSTTPGAHLKRKPTPGAPLKKSSTFHVSSSTNKSHASSLLRKLIHWPKKPFLASRSTSDHDKQADIKPHDEPFLSTRRTPMTNISKTNLLLDESTQANSIDKWGNRREVSLSQCCQTCLNVAEVGKDPNHEIAFSDRARKHYYSKSWFLEDVVKQDGIPAQQVKLLSKELGPPYDAWVAQVIDS